MLRQAFTASVIVLARFHLYSFVWCFESWQKSGLHAVLDAMADNIQAMGVGLVQMHAESGPGQFEIVIKHTDPLQAADHILLTREAITATAAGAGLRASLHPRPDMNGLGSACHCHFSLVHLVSP